MRKESLTGKMNLPEFSDVDMKRVPSKDQRPRVQRHEVPTLQPRVTEG